MKYTITNEPHETIELVCEGARYSLVQNAKTEFQKVIVLNKREALKLYQALQEEILGVAS